MFGKLEVVIASVVPAAVVPVRLVLVVSLVGPEKESLPASVGVPECDVCGACAGLVTDRVGASGQSAQSQDHQQNDDSSLRDHACPLLTVVSKLRRRR